MNLDTNRHSVFKLYYHLILVIKYRRKVIDDDINDYDIIVYSPMGSGSRSHGMVVKSDTRRVVVFNYGAR